MGPRKGLFFVKKMVDIITIASVASIRGVKYCLIFVPFLYPFTFNFGI